MVNSHGHSRCFLIKLPWTFTSWSTTIINYNRRLSRRPRSRNDFSIFLFLPFDHRRKDRRVQYVRGQSIIHRIGTKCLFTSSFELSKLGTISDLRLGSREVPRVRSVIYVSPSPKRDPPPTTIQATFNPFCRPSTHPSILITTSDSLVDWIRDPFVHPVCLFDLQTSKDPITPDAVKFQNTPRD